MRPLLDSEPPSVDANGPMTAMSSELVPAHDPRGTSSSPAADIERARLDEVRALMLELAVGERFERLGAIVQEHLSTGGKRMRARLALASLEALGADVAGCLPWAAACELLHNAALVHDDLQDHDALRRGSFTVWVRHGQAQAINAGDLMLMLPYLALERLDVEPGLKWGLTRALARRAEATVRGQSLELDLLGAGHWDWASYSAAALGKTSALIALPVEGAALLAGRAPARAAALGDAAQRLGLLFQIQDDVLDLYGEKGRAEPGGDLRQGRVTALVVEHLRSRPEDRDWLISLLAQPETETPLAQVEEAAARFERGGALEATLGRIGALRQELASDPVLEEEPGLKAVLTAAVERALEPLSALGRDLGASRV